MPKIQYISRSKLLWGFKFLVIVMGLAYLISYFRTTSSENILIINTLSVQKIILICFVLLVLSFLNWVGEIKKWQVLVSDISFFESSKQTLIAHSLSIFTPQKIGEYGGKLLFYSKTKQTKIIGLTAFGHLSQLLATLVCGGVGFLLWFSQMDTKTLFSLKWSWTVLIIPIILIVKPIRIQLKKIIQVLVQIENDKKYKAVGWSFFRYLIFSHQFYFLLWIFEINMPYINAMGAISIVYVVASVIPVFSIADALVKGSIALTVFSFMGFGDPSTVAVVFLMWISNVMFPAVIGYMWMLKWQPKLLMAKS